MAEQLAQAAHAVFVQAFVDATRPVLRRPLALLAVALVVAFECVPSREADVERRELAVG